MKKLFETIGSMVLKEKVSHVAENLFFAYAKTKAQISCTVPSQLISALVFAT